MRTEIQLLLHVEETSQVFVTLTLLVVCSNAALGTAPNRERANVLKFASRTFDHKEKAIHDLEVEAGVVKTLSIHLRRVVDEDDGSVKEAERLCKLLAFVYQCSDEVAAQSFCGVGATLVLSIFKLMSKHTTRAAESELKYAKRLLGRLSLVEVSLQSMKKSEAVLAFLHETIGNTGDANNTRMNHALSLLAGLTVHRDSKAIVMKFPGLFKAVVTITCSNLDQESKYQSARVLSKLAWHAKNRATMGRTQKCVDALVAMSDSVHQKLKVEALTALQLLSIESDNKAKLVASTKGKLVPSLMGIVGADAGNKLRLQALHILLNLISRQTFKSIGLQPGLVNSLEACSTSRKEPDAIAALAAQSIKRLATYVQVKDKCHEDLLRAIVQMSRCERKSVMKWAAKGFLDQSALSSNSFYIVRDQDAMKSVTGLITCPHRDVREPALETVVKLSEHRSGAKKLASSNCLIAALVGTIDDQTDSNGDDAVLQRHAVTAILSLVSHRSSTKRIAKHFGLVAALSRYGIAAQDNDVELKRAALSAVIVLAPFL